MKEKISAKKYLIVTFIVLMMVILVVGIMWQISKSRSFQFFGGIVQQINTSEKVVALTFDDGPSKENTKAVLDILNKLGVKATFEGIVSDLKNKGYKFVTVTELIKYQKPEALRK